MTAPRRSKGRSVARRLARLPLLVAAVVTLMALSWALVGLTGGRDEPLAEPPGAASPPAATAPAASPSHGASASPSPTATRSGEPTASASRPEPDPRPTPTPETPPPGTPADPPPAAGSGPWRPEPGTAWHWQLTGRLDMDVPVPVYDIDGFDHDAATVAQLHQRGVKVICYINVGAWESWRPDAADFPESVLGQSNGWDGERWLDIRRLDTLRPLIGARFDMCRDKGFDAVEPDLMDGYANRTGFPLTAEDQLTYNRVIAELAHERGLSVGLKNDLGQIPRLVDAFDFAVNESCFVYDECHLLTPFVDAGKAVFHVEYATPAGEFCARARGLELSSMVKGLELDAWSDPCW